MNRERILTAGVIFEAKAPTQGVMQDKAPQVRYTVGSDQPYITEASPVYPSKQHGSEKRQTAHVSARIPHHIKTGLLQIAEQNGWSESKVVATACEAYLEKDLGEKFGVRLAAQLTDALHKELQTQSNREANLAREGFYSAEEGRLISIYILRFLLGEDIAILPEIIKDSQEQAWENLKGYTDAKEREQAQNRPWQS